MSITIDNQSNRMKKKIERQKSKKIKSNMEKRDPPKFIFQSNNKKQIEKNRKDCLIKKRRRKIRSSTCIYTIERREKGTSCAKYCIQYIIALITGSRWYDR